MTEQVLDN